MAEYLLKKITDENGDGYNVYDTSAVHTADVVSTYSSAGTAPVNGQAVKDALDSLDATVSSTDGTNVQVQVTETNGKITSVNITDDTANRNHTHSTVLTDGGDSPVTLSANTTYTLSAGGTSVSFKTPADNNSHRKIQVNGTEVLGDNTTPLNLSAGDNISITNAGSGKIKIDNTYAHPTATSAAAAAVKIGRDSDGHVIIGSALSKSDVGLSEIENSKHAGGTALTLNGQSKVSTSAEIYAPVTSGATGKILQANGDGQAPTWVDASASHTHAIGIASATNGSITLTAGKSFTLTAGGGTTSFTMPNDTNTHRKIQVNGTEVLGNNETALNLSAGTNISITDSGNGKIKIDNTYTHPTTDASAAAARKIGRDQYGHVVIGNALTKSDVGLGNVVNQTITVTNTSVSDGEHTFNQYTHPTVTSAAAAAVTVGYDELGHTVTGRALTKSDVGLSNVENKTITVTTTSVSDGTNTFNKYVHPTGDGNNHIPAGGSDGQFLKWSSAGSAQWVNNPNSDTKVAQTVTTAAGEYPILTKGVTAATTVTGDARFVAGVTINPSTSAVKATTFVGSLSGTADVANKLGTSNLGSTTKPIYLSGGTPKECSTYAGGTKVNFNGTDKSGGAITAYAPTAAGTNGYVLKSKGSGAPEWVEKAPKAEAADSALKLTTARTTYVTLGTASTTTTRDWSGETTIPVAGTLNIANGGTGATDAEGARTNLSVYSKAETETLLAGKVIVVASYSDLPTSGEAGVIYYVKAVSTGDDQYDEYIWAVPPGGSTESYIKVDTHSVDLSNYKTKQTAVDTSAATDDGTGLKFISSFKQNENGNITDVKTKTVTVASTYSSTGTDPVNGKAVLAAIQTLDAEKTSTDGTNVQVKVTETDGKITAVNITTDNTSNKNHTHGNITSGGAITATGVAIANGDAIVISDSSDSSLVKKTSITFDGSTTTKALTQKGTWETFNNYSHPTATTAAPAAVKVGNDNLGHVVIGDALTKTDVGLSAIDNYKYAAGTQLKLNGTTKSATSAEIYAPTTSGVAGYVLKSNGANSAPTWVAQNTVSAGYASSAGKIGTSTLGGVDQPIYWNAGVPATANKYAGGTSLTLNGTSQAGSAASIYAPTTTGTANYVLKSNGNGQAPTWVSAAPSATYAASAAAAENANSANAATTAAQIGTTDVGTSTKPVYISAGVPKQGSTYAGGTKITLNGTSKGGSTAAIYAPTAAGTNGQVLQSNGTDAPTWIDASATHTHAIGIASGSTGAITLSAGKSFTLSAGGETTTFTMPADNNTHRPINVNGTQLLGNNDTALDLIPGSNITLTTAANGKVTIANTYSYSHPAGSASSKTGTPTADAAPGWGGTFQVNQIKTDSTSHVSSITNRTITIPSATFGGATSDANGSIGLVPAPTSGNQNKFLKADGTWATPSDNNDKVKQTVKTDNAEYPLLAKDSTEVTTVTATSNFVAGVTINPSTSAIKATKFIGALQGNADTASKLGTDTVGSTTAPIYLSAGVAKQGSTYAGGTSLTLNGTSKSAATAAIYAPTTSGTANYILQSNGANAAPTWVETVPKARAVVDYGATAKAIEIGWAGAAVTTPTYFAVYTDSSNGYNKAIKDCALSNVRKAINGTSVGSTTQPIYINESGAPTVIGYTIAANVPSNAVFTDTKNTAGTTNKSDTKMFLVAATEQGANPQTYSNSAVYIGTNNQLYSNGTAVLTAHQSVTNSAPTLSWGNTSTIGTVGSTSLTVKMPSNPNTDTKQNITLATTTKAFVTCVTATPTSTAQALTGVADTGVYLTSAAGELNATQFKVNEHCTMQYNSTKSSLDFIFS